MTFCALITFITFPQKHPQLVKKKTPAVINPMQVAGKVNKNTLTKVLLKANTCIINFFCTLKQNKSRVPQILLIRFTKY